ncbi:glycine cleavage system protein GcvH [Rubrivirga sp.]|uniref:glycine cleavage system protein GcvH n=1 Tax=Rubrivirga sp. TaxID=1885344 RepID=UPI003C76B2CC
MTFPDDLRYTKDHEWVRLEDGVAVVGITDYAQGELGDIVFVEYEVEAGDDLEAEDSFGTVEAVKTVSELFAPVAGTVQAVNDDLDGSPESVNGDPYGDGWMIKITPRSAADIDGLLSVDDYKEMIGA